jgi:tRNA A-37 threonylcarbamoyl transferase component Bud32
MDKAWTTVRLDASLWQVDPKWRAALLGGSGLRLDEWSAQRRVAVVKTARHRTVYRVALPEGCIFIKHYPVGDWRSRVRQWFRPGKALAERATAEALAARQIPTVEPVAIGVGPLGDSYLVTRELTNTLPLDVYLLATAAGQEATVQAARRHAVTRGLAGFLARLHDAGLRHTDLHAGNLLVRPVRSDGLEWMLIDLFEARLGPPLDEAESLRSLIQVGLWFLPRSTPADRLRFWRAYRAARGWPTGRDDKIKRGDLEEQLWSEYLRGWWKRQRRCTSVNREFVRLRGGQCIGWAVRDMIAPDVLARWLHDPNSVFAEPTTHLLKHSRSSSVAEVDLDTEAGPRRVIYKRFMPTQWYDPLLHWVRPAPALRSWQHAFWLLDVGLPTPRPLAVFERWHGGLPRESYLVTERIDGAMSLRALADRTTQPDERRKLLDAVSSLIRRFHRHGLSHRDLKAANLLAVPGPEPRLYFIDLVGVGRHAHLPIERRVQNLARLMVSFLDAAWLTRTDRMRFLRHYLQREFAEHGKTWWRAIAAAVARKTAQNAARGRPLS